MDNTLKFRYRPLLRPAGFATLPPGLKWDYIEAPASNPIIATRRGLPLSLYQHGVIACDRQLTAEERERYDLAPA